MCPHPRPLPGTVKKSPAAMSRLGKSPLAPLFQRGELGSESRSISNVSQKTSRPSHTERPPLTKEENRGIFDFFTAPSGSLSAAVFLVLDALCFCRISPSFDRIRLLPPSTGEGGDGGAHSNQTHPFPSGKRKGMEALRAHMNCQPGIFVFKEDHPRRDWLGDTRWGDSLESAQNTTLLNRSRA